MEKIRLLEFFQKYILENLGDEKHPKDCYPPLSNALHEALQEAAANGHTDVFQLIIDSVEDKNPKNESWRQTDCRALGKGAESLWVHSLTVATGG